MDPLSIAAAATGLATFAFSASKSIYDSIDDVRSADATLLQLQSEVNALHSGLQSIASTFNSDTILQLCKNESNSLKQLQSARVLNSVMPLLTDCQCTLEKLEAVLATIAGNPGRMRDLLGKPIEAFKISIKSKDVELIRHEIRSYSSAMQMTLHMVGICLTSDGNKQTGSTGAVLEQKLLILAAQIIDVQQKVSDTDSAQTLSGETLIATDSEAKDHTAHIRKHIEAAKEVFSNGSVYAGSVSDTVLGDEADISGMAETFGSVLGLDEQKRRRIDNWLPKEDDLSEERDDDDVETEMFDARLILAREKLEARDYKAAEVHFRKCLDLTAIARNLPLDELVDVKLEYSLACQGSGNLPEERSLLVELLEYDLPKTQIYDLQHRLASVYLHDGEFVWARKFASQAMKGRRKLLGSRHQAYLETVKLLVETCKAQNNLDDAGVYESLLPANFAAPKSEDPVNSVESAAAIKVLLDNGFDIANKDTYFAAATWAIQKKQYPALRLLLSRGLDLKGTAPQLGRTILMQASEKGFDDIVRQLLKQGADASARDNFGATALWYAARDGHTETAKLLIDAGTSVDVQSTNGQRPLHVAAFQGHIDAVNLLLDRGANVNAPAFSGCRALTQAVNGGPAIVKLLLDHGADVNGADDHGSTALIRAADTDRTDVIRTSIVELLLDRGANVDIKDKRGNTAIKMAKQRRNKLVLQLLKSKRTSLFRKK